MGLCLGCKQQRDNLVGSGMVPSRFRHKYNLAGGNCNVLAMFSPVTFGGSVWVCAWAVSSKGTILLVLAWFQADSGTNII